MSYKTRIRQGRDGMSKSFGRLADFILDSYVETAFLTASDLANQLDLDPATVVRFAQHLGYNGYPELLYDIRQQVKSDLAITKTSLEDGLSAPNTVEAALDKVQEAIEQLKISLSTDAVLALAEQAGEAGRILVIAEGPARASAYNLVYALEQGNFPVTQVSPGLSSLARVLHNATHQDLWITIDFSEEVPYLAPAIREARARGVHTVTIAGAPSLASTFAADLVLAGRGYETQALQIMAIESMVYTLVKALQNLYPERYRGARKAIESLSSLLQ